MTDEMLHSAWRVPLPFSRRTHTVTHLNDNEMTKNNKCLRDSDKDRQSCAPSFGAVRYVRSPLLTKLGVELTKSINSCCSSSTRHSVAPNIGGKGTQPLIHSSALCPSDVSVNNIPTNADFGLGLIFLGAMMGDAEAYFALMKRYTFGIGGMPLDKETAAWWAMQAVETAAEAYHRIGGQPVLQNDRIDDNTEKEIDKGNSGNDDELIQHQRIRADEGDVASMIATADLLYYGARGVPRNQMEALHYYEQAAQAGNPAGMCGAANMLLKGEGSSKNLTGAMTWYEEAADLGAVRALNGLGYIYFYGQVVEKNETKAFEYFMKAALIEKDGDSLHNAGFCLESGIGTDQDLPRAADFYRRAAEKFGHFASAKSLGTMLIHGRGVMRNSDEALKFLSAANNAGPWGGWLRRGLDQYLGNAHKRSLMCYLHAAELGYEVAQSNAAFVLRRRIKTSNQMDWLAVTKIVGGDIRGLEVAHRLQNRLLILSAFHGNRDSMFLLGHSYFEGLGVRKDFASAFWWYSRASSAGSAMGSAYVGAMYHFGLGLEKDIGRASRYYQDALDKGEREEKNALTGAVVMPMQIRVMLQSLIWMTALGNFQILSPLALSVEYVVKILWNE